MSTASTETPFVPAAETSTSSTIMYLGSTEVSFVSATEVSCLPAEVSIVPAEVCSAATEITMPVKMTMAAEKMSVVMGKAEAESDMVRKIGVRVGISESPGIVIAVRPGSFLAGIAANVT